MGRAGKGRGREGARGRADHDGAGGAQATAPRSGAAAGGARDPKKSDGLLRQGEQVRFDFIRAEKATHDVTILCEVLQVSRQGYYAWLSREACRHRLRDEE